MSEIPAELRYAASHEWAKNDDGVVTVGITEHAQDAMGDLVYVELPEVGQVLAAGAAGVAGIGALPHLCRDPFGLRTGTLVKAPSRRLAHGRDMV